MEVPTEIWIKIIQYTIPTISWFSVITRKRTKELTAYSKVNRMFRSIAQPLLYQRAALTLDNIRDFLFSVRKLYLEDKVLHIQISVDEEVFIKDSLKHLLTQCTELKSLGFFDVKNIQGIDLAMGKNLESIQIDGGSLVPNYYYPLASLRNLSTLSTSSFYHPQIMPQLRALVVNYSELKMVSSFFGILGSNLEALAVHQYVFNEDKSDKVDWSSLVKLKILFLSPRSNQSNAVVESGIISILNKIPSKLDSLSIPRLIQFLDLRPIIDTIPSLVDLRLVILTELEIDFEKIVRQVSDLTLSDLPYVEDLNQDAKSCSSEEPSVVKCLSVEQFGLTQVLSSLFWELNEEMEVERSMKLKTC